MGRRESYRNKQALHNAAPLAQSHSQPLGITIGARTSNAKVPKETIPTIYYEKVLKYMKTKDEMNEIAQALTKYLYSPSDWKHYYFEHRWKEYANVRRALRGLVQMGTLQVLLRGKYYKEETISQEGSSSSSLANNTLEKKEEELTIEESKEPEEPVETFTIGGRSLVRKAYVPPPKQDRKSRQALLVEEEEEKVVEEEEEEVVQKGNKKRKNKKNKKSLQLEEDNLEGDEINLDEFEITNEEDKPQLYELNEWKEDPKKKKKQNKKQGKKQRAVLEIEEDGFVKEEENDVPGVPVKVVHIDFNTIKKVVKGTEKIDCIESDAVQAITGSSSKKSSRDLSEGIPQKTVIQVVKGDILESAINLRRICKLNPLVLVSGSQTVPGGSFDKGGNTQEEDFCRRSSLALSLADPYRFDDTREWTYPLPEFGGVYTPNIIVIRGPKSEGYAYLDKTSSCSMFVMYPYVNPPTEKRKVSDTNSAIPEEGEEDSETTEHFLSAKLASSMKKKIAAYCDVALKKGHDSLVIGALGCENTHSNPAYHIALLFKEVLSNEIFRDKFKVVLFSILVDNETDSKLANEAGAEDVQEVDNDDADDDNTQEGELANLLDSSAARKNNLSVFSKLFHGKEDAPSAQDFISTLNL